jgi:hypothetical protein
VGTRVGARVGARVGRAVVCKAVKVRHTGLAGAPRLEDREPGSGATVGDACGSAVGESVGAGEGAAVGLAAAAAGGAAGGRVGIGGVRSLAPERQRTSVATTIAATSADAIHAATDLRLRASGAAAAAAGGGAAGGTVEVGCVAGAGDAVSGGTDCPVMTVGSSGAPWIGGGGADGAGTAPPAPRRVAVEDPRVIRGGVTSVTKSSSASRIDRASGNRSSGSRSSARITISARSGWTSDRREVSGSGASVNRFIVARKVSSPRKGSEPHSMR